MQSHRRFVQDIEGTYQRTSQGRDQIHPLTLSSGKGVAGSVKSQIRQAHVLKTGKPVTKLFIGLPYYGSFSRVQFYVPEKIQALPHVHLQNFSYVFPRHSHIEGFLFQTASVTARTLGLPAETAEHIFELDFILLSLHPLKKLIYSDRTVRLLRNTPDIPEYILLLFREFAIWGKNIQSQGLGILDKNILEPTHLLPSPAGYGPIVYALCLIRHHQVLTNANHLPKSPAVRTGSDGTIEAEHIVIRLFED